MNDSNVTLGLKREREKERITLRYDSKVKAKNKRSKAKGERDQLAENMVIADEGRTVKD